MVEIEFIRLDNRAVAPIYAYPNDAGADLSCLEDFEIQPGERKLIRTGIAIALPQGFVGLIHPRSGLALKHGISIVNAPGTIDSDYRGEILINLINLDQQKTFSAEAGSRIAQLLIQEFKTAIYKERESLSITSRGQNGHGSTEVGN